jgi:Beta propeller domain
LVVWGATSGTILKTIEMPSANDTSTETASSRKSDMMWYPQENNINSLVLHQGKLVVTVSMHQGDMYGSRILSDYMSTCIRVYDVASLMSSPSSTEESGLVGIKFVSGAFSSVRVTNGVAHVVSTSYVNAYMYLNYPYKETNETVSEYDARISNLTQEMSQNFTQQLMQELQAGGATPKLTRINLWDESYPKSTNYNPYTGGLLQSLVTIHSFDLASQVNGAELSISSSGSFVPGWSYVYGVANRLILATSVWQYNATTSAPDESVALLAFDLNGASATARSVGRVPGTILNQYYVDVLGDNLRIAVTIRNNTSTMFGGPEMGGDMMIDTIPWTSPDTENYVLVMSLPSATSEDPGKMIEQSRVKIGKPKESITAVRFFDTYAYALTAEKKDPFYVIDVSNAANLSVVAELEIPGFTSYLHPITPDGTRLLAIGENSDNEGMVTGIQLTVFDVSVPSDPKNISRFVLDAGSNASVYTESAWDFKSSRYYDGYLFLPVDLSSYYSSNPSDSFMGTMVFKIDNVTGAITEDTQCRIANQKTVGIYFPLDGLAFDEGSSTLPYPGSGSTNITKKPCNYTGNLNPRSMIFNGNVMTARQNEVIMTDLNTCGRLWNFTIGIPVPGGCDSYW